MFPFAMRCMTLSGALLALRTAGLQDTVLGLHKAARGGDGRVAAVDADLISMESEERKELDRSATGSQKEEGAGVDKTIGGAVVHAYLDMLSMEPETRRKRRFSLKEAERQHALMRSIAAQEEPMRTVALLDAANGHTKHGESKGVRDSKVASAESRDVKHEDPASITIIIIAITSFVVICGLVLCMTMGRGHKDEVRMEGGTLLQGGQTGQGQSGDHAMDPAADGQLPPEPWTVRSQKQFGCC